MGDGRYLANEDAYFQHVSATLAQRFKSKEELRAFYDAIPAERKDDFLRVASFYRYLVKEGDWHTRGTDPPVQDYLTNSFKAIALFGLIESISGDAFIDFYAWLRVRADALPIQDGAMLHRLHEEYLDSYGSIRRCVEFFRRLPEVRRTALCNAITQDSKPLPSIEAVARLLFELRSRFVHEGELVLALANAPAQFRRKANGKSVVCDVSIADLQQVFEEGLLLTFRAAEG